MNLYEMTGEFWIILGENDGELTPEQEAQLDSLDMAIEKKVEALLQHRQNLLGDVEAIAAEEHRLREKKEVVRNKAEQIKTYVQTCLQRAGIAKVSTPLFSARLQQGPPKVVIEEGAPVTADEFLRVKTTYELDKKKIIEAWESGGVLPQGVSVVRETHLRVT